MTVCVPANWLLPSSVDELIGNSDLVISAGTTKSSDCTNWAGIMATTVIYDVVTAD